MPKCACQVPAAGLAVAAVTWVAGQTIEDRVECQGSFGLPTATSIHEPLAAFLVSRLPTLATASPARATTCWSLKPRAIAPEVALIPIDALVGCPVPSPSQLGLDCLAYWISTASSMAPSTNQLEAALIDGTYHVFTAEPDATTVNKVRKHVEESLHLEEGFFAGEDWKQKSKVLIKQYVDKLLDGWVPDSTRETQSENRARRGGSEEAPSSPRRKKLASENGKYTAHDERLHGSDKDTIPRPKKVASRRKTQTANSTENIGNVLGPPPPKKRKQKDSSASAKSPTKSPPTDEGGDLKDDAMSSIEVDVTNPAVNEEEEFSDVIDEAPKPKRKKKERKDSSSKPSRPKVKKTTESSPDDPDEAEIKKLQSQLVKCGVRKLWHNELKKYGDDARAKIRHLKKMLTEVGMDGRFSEAKAREIRETRELLAEAEAAQEMNRLWGMGTGGRASRSTNKSIQVEESGESEAEDAAGDDGTEDDNEEGGTSFAARRRRAQADLAFLGDDSESDE
ncbi:transcriptional regulator [Metarhizium album ARSEF 1941]|uniref:Transcriptional regulator n=1 Tax=Metarhizium album (strain ARSEF 1941) TaxID=1081103 RepID=A0A0B2WUK2_METAS|nr:transcriptional regulator [Metarhizium album ARSEF 1941]KHN97177.1 transcriptional regulator [Metarhizium album ARSEF 1941]